MGQMPFQLERLKQALTKAATCFNLKLFQRQVLSKLNDLQWYRSPKSLNVLLTCQIGGAHQELYNPSHLLTALLLTSLVCAHTDVVFAWFCTSSTNRFALVPMPAS